MRLDQHFLKSALSKVEFKGKINDNVMFALNQEDITSDTYSIIDEKNDVEQSVKKALAKGAVGFLVSQKGRNRVEEIAPKASLIVVEDVTRSLCKLAKAWRSNFCYSVIGITGSVGKSCTKKMLSNILEENKIAHLATLNIGNSTIELALDVLRMQQNHRVALFEMGVNKRGKMVELADMVRPSYAIITNVGHSHLEGLGSLSDIALEQRDIFKFFDREGIGIINGDTSILSSIGYIHPVIKFGSRTTNQIQARKIYATDTRISFVLKLYKKKYQVVLSDTHEGSVFNALAATAAAYLLGATPEKIIKGIQHPLVIPSRFEHRLLSEGKGMLIDDCSSSNPESMKIALLAFQHIDTKGQKIAVIGDMKGLGVNSPFWHRQLGRFLRKVPSLKHLILVGDLVKWTRKTLPVRVNAELVKTSEEAAQKLKEKLDEESLVFIKGSDSGLRTLVSQFSNTQHP